MSDQITKNQHKLPRMYAKSWCTSEKRIFYYEPSNQYRKIDSTGLKRAESEDWFYDDENPFQINENSFGKIEDPTEKIIDQILREQKISNLTLNQRFILSTFIYLQYLRTDTARQRIKTRLYIDDKNCVSEEKFNEKLRSEHTKTIFNTFQLTQILKIFNYKWILLENCSDCGIFLSDNPVYLENKYCDRLNYMESLYLYNFHTEDFTANCLKVYFPLSPFWILLIYDPTLNDEYSKLNDLDNAFIEPESIYGLNLIFLKDSLKRIYFRESDTKYVQKIITIDPKTDKWIKLVPVLYRELYDSEKYFLNLMKDLFSKVTTNGFSQTGDGTFLTCNTRFEIEFVNNKLSINLLYEPNFMAMTTFDKDPKKTNPIDTYCIPLMNRMCVKFLNDQMKHNLVNLLQSSEDNHQILQSGLVRLNYIINLKQEPLNHDSRKNKGNLMHLLLWLNYNKDPIKTAQNIDNLASFLIWFNELEKSNQ